MSTVITPEQAITLAATLARRSGGQKRKDYRAIVEQAKNDVEARLAHIEAEQRRAAIARRRGFSPRDAGAAMRMIAGVR